MTSKEIIFKVKSEIDNYVDKYEYLPESNLIKDVRLVINLLENEFNNNPLCPNERVLRGFKDISTSVAVSCENTGLEEEIVNLYKFLRKRYPNIDSLELLRNDWGKGNPI